jgi:hypothetical protein
MTGRRLLAIAIGAALFHSGAALAKDCLGACGSGCSDQSCSTTNTAPDDVVCDSDGTAHVTQHLTHHCWVSDCCYWHDGCQRDCGLNPLCIDYCAGEAVGRGCGKCYGSGYPGCDPNGYWADIEPWTQSYTMAPGNVLCPTPPPVCQGACPAGFTWDTGSCSCICTSSCDTCWGCQACGDCPPPCNDTCNGCGTYTGCGRYCGDCPVNICFDTCDNCYGCEVCGDCPPPPSCGGCAPRRT